MNQKFINYFFFLIILKIKIRDFDKIVIELKKKDEIIDGLAHENEELRHALEELDRHKAHNEKAKKSAKQEKDTILEDMAKMKSDYENTIAMLSQEIERLNTILKMKDNEIEELKHKLNDLNENVFIINIFNYFIFLFSLSLLIP